MTHAAPRRGQASLDPTDPAPEGYPLGGGYQSGQLSGYPGTAPAPAATGSALPANAAMVRLTISSAERRLDITVPAILPVVELLPEFARELGALTTESAYGGFRLLRQDGRSVDADRSLQAQGIEDGFILTLVAGAGVAGVRVYDDVVEAVADVIESEFKPWQASRSALVGQAAATSFLIAAALVLALDRSDHVLVSATAAIAALVVLSAAVVVSRRRDAMAPVGLMLAGAAATLAAVAGYRALQDTAWSGGPLALAGAGVLLVGALGYLSITTERELFLSAVVGGAIVAITGGLIQSSDLSAVSVFSFAMALTVLAGNALGWLSMSWTRITPQTPRTEAEIYADPVQINPGPLAAAVRRGHRLLIALGLAVGAVVLVLAPVVTGSGITGTVLCLLCGTALMLRTRHSRTTADVAVGLLGGVLLLAETAVAASLQHPHWRTPVALTLAVVAAALVSFSALAPRIRVRLGRIADGVDVLNLVALLPLAVITAGVIGGIRR